MNLREPSTESVTVQKRIDVLEALVARYRIALISIAELATIDVVDFDNAKHLWKRQKIAIKALEKNRE